MIGIKYNNPTQVFDVLIDSEPDSSMILCKDKYGAMKILDEYLEETLKEVNRQYFDAVDKIRRVK
jgi:hypothetical protein